MGLSGRLAVRGFDIDPIGIREARMGRYLVPRLLYYDVWLERVRDTLDEYGFTYDFETVLEKHDAPDMSLLYPAKGYYQVDASPIRAGNSAEFAICDLVRDKDIEGSADLIFANNVLYHLPPDRATAAVRKLASVLTDKGVFGLGKTTMSEPTEWAQDTIALLKSEFDLYPIMIKQANEPFIPTLFGRKQEYATTSIGLEELKGYEHPMWAVRS